MRYTMVAHSDSTHGSNLVSRSSIQYLLPLLLIILLFPAAYQLNGNFGDAGLATYSKKLNGETTPLSESKGKPEGTRGSPPLVHHTTPSIWQNKDLLWPKSTLQRNLSLCEDAPACLKQLKVNPVAYHVRYVQGRLQFYDVDTQSEDYKVLPKRSTVWSLGKLNIDFPNQNFHQAGINVAQDCDVVWDKGPVVISYPHVGHNAFHSHNDNIFKLVQAAMATNTLDMLNVSKLVLLNVKSNPSKILSRWYSLYDEVLPYSAMQSNQRICIKLLQWGFRYDVPFYLGVTVDKYTPIPFPPHYKHWISAFRYLFHTRIYPSAPYPPVDRSSAKGKVLVYLDREKGLAGRKISLQAVGIIRAEFEKAGVEFVHVVKDSNYKDIDFMFATLRRASIVMGPHGAGMAHLIYAPPRCLVFELRAFHAPETRLFETMAVVSNMDHVGVSIRYYKDGKSLPMRSHTQPEAARFVDVVLKIYEEKIPVSTFSYAWKMPFLLNASFVSCLNQGQHDERSMALCLRREDASGLRV